MLRVRGCGGDERHHGGIIDFLPEAIQGVGDQDIKTFWGAWFEGVACDAGFAHEEVLEDLVVGGRSWWAVSRAEFSGGGWTYGSDR